MMKLVKPFIGWVFLLTCVVGCTPPTSEDPKKKETTEKFFASPTPHKDGTPKGYSP